LLVCTLHIMVQRLWCFLEKIIEVHGKIGASLRHFCKTRKKFQKLLIWS
jgi:hypothetical protein